MTLYAGAGEATIYRDPGPAGEGPEVRARVDPDPVESARANRERVVRRIRGKARRYAVANRCDQVVTLTYRPGAEACATCERGRPWLGCRACRDRVKRDVQLFERRLRRIFGPVPLVRVLEDHKDGSIHVHAVMPRRFARNERASRLLATVWGHGFVDGDPAKRARGRSAREWSRLAAGYAVKYAAKNVDAGVLDPFEHALEVTEGFQPIAVRARQWTRAGAVEEAVALMAGEVPRYEWFSDGVEGWRGPPVVFLGW